MRLCSRLCAPPGGYDGCVYCVAFFEVGQGGHSVIGDKLYLDGVEVGVLAEYEMNHMPKHMNIVITRIGGSSWFRLEGEIRIQ